MKVLVIFGTRPEAIKLAPVIRALQDTPGLQLRTCATGQHRRLLDQALSFFDLTPDLDLDLMAPGQQPDELAGRLLTALGPVIQTEAPDLVVVQGDTTSAMAGAMAASWRGVPVAHVEAGLRSGDLEAPFPEEGNRRQIDQIAALHFAPTLRARDNLLGEGLGPDSIEVTGNTGIDALLQTVARIQDSPPVVEGSGPLVLVTAHRRESFGAPIAGICDAVRQVARRPGVRVAFPVHPNPVVDGPVRAALFGLPRVHLLPPLPYPQMVRLMTEATVLLTDSGGLQEEAPSLGLRVLVCRSCSERTEGLEAGAAELVGTQPSTLTAAVEAILDDPATGRFHGQNPYGDGHAAVRIARSSARRGSDRAAG